MSNNEIATTSLPLVQDSLPSDERCDRRASMQSLPNVLQPFLTWVTGKPANGQIARQKRPLLYLSKVIALLCAGLFISFTGMKLQSLGFLLLVCGWIATVSATRQLQVVVVHHCTHKNFSGHRKLDQWIGRIISAIMLFRDFDTYEHSHTQHHRNPLDSNDETVKFLSYLAGIEPGQSRIELWKRLRLNLISPIFHAKFLTARLVSSLWASSFSHRILSWACLLCVLTVTGINNAWQTLGIIWVLPLTILYQSSTLLRLCSEHVWVPLEPGRKRNKAYYSQATVGIFLGDATPHPNQSGKIPFLREWLVWWSRLLLIYLPLRIFVLVGDTSCHDYHHRHPGADDWLNAVFARQQDIDAGCPGWSQPYQEVFGLFAAIDLVFTALSQQPAFESKCPENAAHTVYAANED